MIKILRWQTLKKNATQPLSPTIDLGVNQAYPPELEISFFRGWAEMPISGIADMWAGNFPLCQ